MKIVELKEILERIRENKRSGEGACRDCPMRDPQWKGCEWEPLLIEPENPHLIRVMVVTEGPNRQADVEYIVSLANHPTYTYIYTLFKGQFKPRGRDANSYWTHVRKCFLDGSKKGKKALSKCKRYLKEEIKALKPRLIIAVGGEALNAVFEKRGLKLEEAFYSQEGGVYGKLVMDGFECEVSVVPHPSGRSRFWNQPQNETKRILEDVAKKIENILKG